MPRITGVAAYFLVADVVRAAEYYRDKLGFEGQDDARHVGGRISVRETAPDGSAIAYLLVGDDGGAFDHHRKVLM